MHTADWIVLIGYLVGTLLMGVLLGRLIKNSADFFAAGERSPWWVSGLSAFMTMFSANTFVVWGGVAYKYGIVAIVINLMYGVAAILAGYFVAGRWKRLGIRTPAEFVEKRFGRRALHFYTWFMMTLRVVGSAGALYAIAKLIIVVISGSESATTGLNWAILAFGLIIVIYTMIGGLWAVLMTDVLQFIILNLAVIAVIPLALAKMGTVPEIVSAAPEGFWSLTAGPKYTWFFLLGWLAIHYFMIGAEWAFVQRYLCVPTAKDARKSSYLFGALYLISPFLWLLPPLLWRISNPIPDGATDSEITNLAENAYILSCKSVLPVGLIGLMLAAMFSATASLVSAQLNVFSGVLTSDIYRAFRPNADERRLVKVGRFFTVVLGVIVTGIALAIPILGGAELVIVAATELMVVPLLAPTLWGLFNRKVPTRALWLTAGICFPMGLLFRFALPAGDEGLLGWLQTNAKLIETFIGVGLPLLITAWVAHTAREDSPGWAKVAALERPPEGSVELPKPSSIPALIVGCSMGACSLMMAALLFVNDENHAVLLSFALVLAAISGTTFFIAARTRRANKASVHK